MVGRRSSSPQRQGFRAGISAIETGRLVPSTSAALLLAMAFECRVEEVFRLESCSVEGGLTLEWAWPPSAEPTRFWRAELNGKIVAFPVETTLSGVIGHDGVASNGRFPEEIGGDPRQTLVMACCDPAAGLLAEALERKCGIRLIALPRSSRSALALLGAGLVHVAGVHLRPADDAVDNAFEVRKQLGEGYSLLRMASWDEGVVVSRALGIRSIRAVRRAKLRWVGRETGSGARECMDEVLQGAAPPKRIASDHRSVAEAVKSGWADAGVCLRLTGEEAGLSFLGVRTEPYDLCFTRRSSDDLRIKALTEIVRSTTFRTLLGGLPGYQVDTAGEMQSSL